jgi:IS30 family transposase
MGKSQKAMAKELEVSPSTISRELRRNGGKKGYRPKQAHKKAMARRKKARRPSKWTALVIYFVEKMLREDFSPEQV